MSTDTQQQCHVKVQRVGTAVHDRLCVCLLARYTLHSSGQSVNNLF